MGEFYNLWMVQQGRHTLQGSKPRQSASGPGVAAQTLHSI